ncbi:response regulator [Pontibacterium granulatum]|uniref:response regulator n=1 Tax=Pontibacterium granulatum TaxID=2036029 RepID=UPI00249A9857|nr:response regulator [Pontibacterium granulatum]MDI3323140.1 response regulator [Pontibacterium granulatum]
MDSQPLALVLSESAELFKETEALLSDYGLQIIDTGTEEAMAQACARPEPKILFIRFQRVEKGIEHYVQLHSSVQNLRNVKHYSVALCGAEETGQALGYCMNHLIDTYIVVDPLHDKFRFNLTIHQALEGLVQSNQQSQSLQFSETIIETKEQLDQLIVSGLSNGMACQTQTLQDFQQLINQTLTELRALPDDALKQLNTATPGLPQQLEQGADTLKSRAEQNIRSWSETLQESYDKLSEQLSIPARGGIYLKKRVMVIDDDSMYASVVKKILMDSGYQPFIHTSAKDALPAMMKQKPDILLLDYEMPDYSGTKVLEYMDRYQQLCDIPVIMLTGHRNKEVFKACMNAGASDFIIKPASKEIFVQKIEKHLSRKATDKNSLRLGYGT